MDKLKCVILDGHTQNPGDLNWDYLEEVFDLTYYPRTPADKIIERAKDADVLVVNKVGITREMLPELPKLKFVATLATGYNQLDCEALKERNIPVSNIPAYSTDGVAQMVFAFILEFSNRVAYYTESVKQLEWTQCQDFCFWKTPLHELSGKTLGIIGFGKIGRKVSEIAKAFGMKVLAYTPSGQKADAEYVDFCDLDTVIGNSDFITLHCPLTKATEKFVNKEFIDKMKKGACLINTARGGVVDEYAVAEALENGKLLYYGTDVLSTEPPQPGNPIVKAPNCFITPHIAWAAYETRVRLLGILNANVKAFLEGHPQNVVNS